MKRNRHFTYSIGWCSVLNTLNMHLQCDCIAIISSIGLHHREKLTGKYGQTGKKKEKGLE